MKNKGFLLVLMQPTPIIEEEFNAWYDNEHVPERVAVPGFESGRRYVCIDGHPRYLAMYDMTGSDVLDTEGYLSVSGDRASPWTKRVTSRVKVYRSAGDQIYPGNEVTVPSPRATLLRFRGLAEGDAGTVVAGMRKIFEGRPDTVQLRIFAYPSEAGVDYLGFVAHRSTEKVDVDVSAFGAAARAIDLVNTYALY